MKKRLDEMTNEELWQLFPILLRPYNPDWPEWYKAEESLLREICGKRQRRLSHIGSTSVPGLVAKPTVDILLEIAPETDPDRLASDLQNHGWWFSSKREDPDLHMMFHKGYTEEGFAEKVYHLHIRRLGDWDELYFRDYLCAHPDVAGEYVALKQRLASMYEHDRDAYTEAKTGFVREATKKARAEFGPRYQP